MPKVQKKHVCERCGATLPPKQRLGRPKRYCPPCKAEIQRANARKYAQKSYERAKLRSGDEESPAKPGARPGDFNPPTGNCSRCCRVVVLSRTDEYMVVRDKKRPPKLLCSACFREHLAGQAVAEIAPGAGGWRLTAQPVGKNGTAERIAAFGRILDILLGLGREDRHALHRQLERAWENIK